jgi:soluble lytic murein transglycosylase-like protein
MPTFSLPRWWPYSTRAFLGLLLAAVAASTLVLFALLRSPYPAAPAKPRPPPVQAQIAKPKVQPPKVMKKKIAGKRSTFATEQMMSPAQLMKRWNSDLAEASKRFGVPQTWIRAVMQIESGGRTMLAENLPMTSSQGAMGLMQLMPDTYDDMRRAYRLGKDPYEPHDNIMAGAAYLKFLRGKYGYPQMFAAYNDGPGNLEQRMRDGGLFPEETRNYLGTITARLEGRSFTGSGGGKVTLTRPNGTAVEIDVAAVTSVRAALPDEYVPGVRTVIKVGRLKQGVREDVAKVKAAIRSRGGAL